jgi:hypothetical protein
MEGRAVRLASLLAGGDRRSIGQADAVAARVAEQPALLAELWDCLADADPVVRMRAADALEKVSRATPAAFNRYKAALLADAFDDGTAEVRWHLMAITSRIDMDAREAERFYGTLKYRLHNDKSRIVKVAALQAAYDMQTRHSALAPLFTEMLSFALSSAWPSVTARARTIGPDDIRRRPTAGRQA